MRIGIFLALSVACAACTYQRTVASPELAPLHRAGHRDPLVLFASDAWRARLSAQSRVRFRHGDAWTGWLDATELHVDARGVWVDGSVPVARSSVRARVTRLAPEELAALERTRPFAATLHRDGGVALLEGTGVMIDRWLGRFVTEVARRHDPRVPLYLCGPDPAPPPGCSLGEYDERARARLRWALAGAPLGTWRFELPGQGWTRPLAGQDLYEARRRYPTRVGWTWRAIDDAQVETLSGGRSLAGVVGVVALAAAVAPFALLGDAVSFPAHMDDPPTGKPSFSQRALDGVGHAIAIGDRDVTPGSWTPELADADGVRAGALFAARARRRAFVQLVVAADALASRQRALGGLTLAARFAEMVEIGGSVRHLAGEGTIGSFYLGGHFALGAPHRWAIPLGFDVGGRDGLGYFRLRAGVRVRVRGDWFVGGYPLNPVYAAREWSYPSGLEVGSAF